MQGNSPLDTGASIGILVLLLEPTVKLHWRQLQRDAAHLSIFYLFLVHVRSLAKQCLPDSSVSTAFGKALA